MHCICFHPESLVSLPQACGPSWTLVPERSEQRGHLHEMLVHSQSLFLRTTGNPWLHFLLDAECKGSCLWQAKPRTPCSISTAKTPLLCKTATPSVFSTNELIPDASSWVRKSPPSASASRDFMSLTKLSQTGLIWKNCIKKQQDFRREPG